MKEQLKKAIELIEKQQKEIMNLETHFISVDKIDEDLYDEVELFLTTSNQYLKEIN